MKCLIFCMVSNFHNQYPEKGWGFVSSSLARSYAEAVLNSPFWENFQTKESSFSPNNCMGLLGSFPKPHLVVWKRFFPNTIFLLCEQTLNKLSDRAPLNPFASLKLGSWVSPHIPTYASFKHRKTHLDSSPNGGAWKFVRVFGIPSRPWAIFI